MPPGKHYRGMKLEPLAPLDLKGGKCRISSDEPSDIPFTLGPENASIVRSLFALAPDV
jgi:hypothetical protein